MKFLKIKLIVIAALVFAASTAFAVPYSIYTPTLNGTSGYLYLQYLSFDGVASTATVSNFSTDGTLGAKQTGVYNTSGVVNGSAVTGTLPGQVVFANTNGINDYNQAITFGSLINFDLLFASNNFILPGAPLEGSSTFSLWLSSDKFGASPLQTDDGMLFLANLSNDGTISSTNLAPVPEPGTIVLLSAGMFGLCIYGKRRSQKLA